MLGKEKIEKRVKKLASEEGWNHYYEFPHGIKTRTNHIDSPGYNTNKWRRMKKFIKIIKNKENIAVYDVGCSDGYFSVKCAKQFRHVTGSDIDDKRIRKALLAKEVYGIGNLTFIREDLYSIHSSRKYGLVMGLGLLHRVPDLDRCIDKLASMGDNVLLEYKSSADREPTLKKLEGKTKSNKHNRLHSIPSNSYVIERMRKNGFEYYMLDQDDSSLNYKRTMILFSRSDLLDEE